MVSEPSPPWLEEPGTGDITAHVDLTAVRQAAERVGLDAAAGIGHGLLIRTLGDRDALQADGEPVGETPVTLTVEQRALTVLLTPGPSPLLTAEAG